MIDQTTKNIKDCIECPYFYHQINQGRKELMWGEGKKVMFIGQSPAATNLMKEKDSAFDRYFLSLLEKSEIDPKTICFTNFCKTSIPYGEKLSEEELSHCVDHLMSEIAEVKPEQIITMGSLAKEFIGLGFDEGVISEFNIVNKNDKIIDIIEVPIYAIKHPGAIKYGSLKETDFINSLNKAYHYGKKEQSIKRLDE